MRASALPTYLGAERGAGGFFVGRGIEYTPEATPLEVIDMFRLAAEYTHACSSGRVEPGSTIWSASLMVECAYPRGLDVTTEAYPYIAGMTSINSALFNPGWRPHASRHVRAPHRGPFSTNCTIPAQDD
jgi:hypothetical protein